MNKVTWNVEMAEEQMANLQQLMDESGLSAKDFMSDVIQTYKIHRRKQSNPVMSHDPDDKNIFDIDAIV